MTPYCHKVQYYETDRMGVTHHSNYIRWMEEARVDLLEQIGWGYDRMESLGIQSPVTGVECAYKAPTTFGDTVEIRTGIREYRGVHLVVWYEMRRLGDGKVVLERLDDTMLQEISRKADAMRRRIARQRPKVRRMGGIDVLLTHAPARGLNDGDDLPHQGFACFNNLLDELKPRWFVHGHIHLFYNYKLPRVCQRGETTVINATERYLFEVPDPEPLDTRKVFFFRSVIASLSK